MQTKSPKSISNRRACMKAVGCASLAWILDTSPARAISIAEDAFEVKIPLMGSLLSIRWILNGIEKSKESIRLLNQSILDEAQSIGEHWNNILSDYDTESEAMRLAKICDSGKSAWPSEDFASVLDIADKWYRRSQGTLDVALGAMTALRRKRSPVHPNDWVYAKMQCGWNLVDWEPCRRGFRFAVVGVRFDFGAIGKGLVADKVYEMLLSKGVDCCIVNFSGNMRIGRAPPGTEGWPLSIDFLKKQDDAEATVCQQDRFHDCGIATSGDSWQRFVDASSESFKDRTSHILDPRTKNGITMRQSSTIVCTTAVDSDAAATATCVHHVRDLAGWLQRLSDWDPRCRWLTQSYDNDELVIRSNFSERIR